MFFHRGTPTGQIGGQITLGGYDSTHCAMTSSGNGLSWIPLSSETYYQFVLSGYEIQISVNRLKIAPEQALSRPILQRSIWKLQ